MIIAKRPRRYAKPCWCPSPSLALYVRTLVQILHALTSSLSQRGAHSLVTRCTAHTHCPSCIFHCGEHAMIMLKDNASESSQSIVGNLNFICKSSGDHYSSDPVQVQSRIRGRGVQGHPWGASRQCCSPTAFQAPMRPTPPSQAKQGGHVGNESSRKNW